MKVLVRITLCWIASAAGMASGATAYERFEHPKGDYALDCPSRWERSYGLQTLNLKPVGGQTRLSIGLYPRKWEGPGMPKNFAADALERAKGLGRMDLRDTIKVSGRDAQRLIWTETVEPKDQAGNKLAGPRAEAIVVVPYGKRFYVLRLAAIGDEFTRNREQFDRTVSSFQLAAAGEQQTEWAGTYDGPDEARMMVARSPEEFHRMIRVFGLNRLPHEVDFGTQMLVAISMGRRLTGGYAVRILDATERDGVAYVRYQERVPGRGQFVTQALTAPYHVKVLSRTDAAKVRFEKLCEPEIYEPDR
jgi:hypothetical protein